MFRLQSGLPVSNATVDIIIELQKLLEELILCLTREVRWWCQNALTFLVKKMAVDHPYHTIYQVSSQREPLRVV